MARAGRRDPAPPACMARTPGDRCAAQRARRCRKKSLRRNPDRAECCHYLRGSGESLPDSPIAFPNYWVNRWGIFSERDPGECSVSPVAGRFPATAESWRGSCNPVPQRGVFGRVRQVVARLCDAFSMHKVVRRMASSVSVPDWLQVFRGSPTGRFVNRSSFSI